MLYAQMALELSGGVEAGWTVAVHGPRPTGRVHAYDGLVRVRVRVGVRVGVGVGVRVRQREHAISVQTWHT